MTNGCVGLQVDGDETWTVPDVFFDNLSPPTNPVVSLDGHVKEINQELFGGEVFELYVESDLDDPNCDLIPPQHGNKRYLVVGQYKGSYWLHDPRFELLENTLENPLMDGGGPIVKQTILNEEEAAGGRYNSFRQVKCMNVPMNPFNMEDCRTSDNPEACSTYDPPFVDIELTADSFKRIYDATGGGAPGTRYLYAIRGLRQEMGSIPYATPCSPGTTSRWMKDTNCNFSVDSATAAIFADLLKKSDDDTNPYVRDISFPLTGISCSAGERDSFGFSVREGNQCWTNVNQWHYSVFDFTDWIAAHPGGDEQIQQFAVQNAEPFILNFPDSHPMSRFYNTKDSYLIEVGRLGDAILFPDLPDVLLTQDLAEEFEVSALVKSLGPSVVCGSENEVQNEPAKFGNLKQGAFDAITTDGRSSGDSTFWPQRQTVWTMIAMNGADSFRQRVAWALSQIVTMAPLESIRTEIWLVSATNLMGCVAR